MEIRAPYALIGVFVLAVIGAVFGFVYWLHNTAGLGERTVYRVRFENTVSGLLKGAAVLFNGIRVGEVTELQLDPKNPKQVMATIAVVAGTPVRSDTQAGLDFQGLTGVPVVTLQGGSADPRGLDDQAGRAAHAGRGSVRRAEHDPGRARCAPARRYGACGKFRTAAQHHRQSADVLGRAGTQLGSPRWHRRRRGAPDRRRPRGRNAGHLRSDGAARGVHVGHAPRGQLIVAEPSAPISFDTRKILVRPAGKEDPSFTDADWADNVPKLLQAKVIQSFENSGFLRTAAKSTEGFTADHQLLIDIRSFQVTTSPAPVGEVEFTAKILGDNGQIVDARIFRAHRAGQSGPTRPAPRLRSTRHSAWP